MASSVRNVGTGQQVSLSGAPTDPNKPALTLTYQWTLTSVPQGSALTSASLSSANTLTPKFTPDVPGTYVVSLVASNTNGASPASTVNVTAYTGNIPPNASAGSAQFVTPSTTVTLSSAASSDPDSGPLQLAYLWWLNSLPSASSTTLTHPLTATPQFVADTSGYFIGRVEATDGLASGFANTLVVSARVCDADANGVINQTDLALIQAALGQTVVAGDPRDFDGSGTITQADLTGCTNLLSGSPVLQVSPSTFTENLTVGSASVQHQLHISSSGAPLSFNVTSNQSWLTVDTPSGSTASVSTLNARVNPASLGVGTFTGTLTFTPGSGTAQTVVVTLNILPQSPPPQIAAFTTSPSSLQIAAATCGGTATGAFTLALTNGQPFNFSIYSDTSWLTFSTPSWSSSGSPVQVTVTANPAGLQAGTYNGNLEISGAGISGYTLRVTFTVAPADTLTASLSSLTFNVAAGMASQAQSLTLGAGCAPLAIAVTSDQPWLSVTPTSGTTPVTLSVTASAVSLLPGNFNGHVIVTSSAAANSPLSIPVSLTANPEVVSAVNSASFVTGPIAPGSLFSLFGSELAPAAVSAQTVPLPTELGGVVVTIGSTPIPLLYVGPTQINAQMPYGVSGTVQGGITLNGKSVGTFSTPIVPVMPGLFILPNTGGHGAVENQDYSVNSPQAPSHPGQVLFAYMTGQGAVSPGVVTGAAAPLSPLSSINAPVTATIGGTAATVLSSTLAPTLVGVGQINVLVPPMASGDYPLVISIGDQVANAGIVSIRP